MRATGAVGMFRRVVASLLVLAMLTLAAAPVLAAPPADHGRHHAAHNCVPADGEAAAIPSDPARPAGDHHGGAPGLACCITSQCPMLLGGLPVPPPQPRPPEGLAVRGGAPAFRSVGIEIPPALRPPRAA